MSDEERVIYRDDYTLVTKHVGHRVGLQVGRPPEDATPTIVDARELRDALDGYLEQVIDDDLERED